MELAAGCAEETRPAPASADDARELQHGLAELDRGELLSVEESEAALRWLETGEGERPRGDQG